MNVGKESFTLLRDELLLVEAQVRTTEIRSCFHFLATRKWWSLLLAIQISTTSLHSDCH